MGNSIGDYYRGNLCGLHTLSKKPQQVQEALRDGYEPVYGLIWTPKYYSPNMGTSKGVPLILGNPHIVSHNEEVVLKALKRRQLRKNAESPPSIYAPPQP